LESKRTRTVLSAKSLRFATREEVQAMTGLQPGAIPPFGSLFRLPTHFEPALSANPEINFNAGDHTISVQMRFEDWLRVEQPIPLEMP
jgi:Ala-tRNA(Pro) deacylase